MSSDEHEENNVVEDEDFIPNSDRWSLKVSTRRKVGMTWNFRGVHRAIICGKIRQPPVQKILQNGRTVTIFTVGTGGMFDQRMIGDKDTPKPAQWHRIAVHNDKIGAYVV